MICDAQVVIDSNRTWKQEAGSKLVSVDLNAYGGEQDSQQSGAAWSTTRPALRPIRVSPRSMRQPRKSRVAAAAYSPREGRQLPPNRWDLDSPRWKTRSPRFFNILSRKASAELQHSRYSAMQAAKAQQLAAVESLRRRLMDFEMEHLQQHNSRVAIDMSIINSHPTAATSPNLIMPEKLKNKLKAVKTQ